MIHSLIKASLALLLCLCIPGLAAAQEVATRMDVATRGLSLGGTSFYVDRKFSERTGKPVDTPFLVVVPASKDGSYVSRINQNPARGWVTFSFVGPDRAMLDAVSLSSGSSPVISDTSVRLERLAAKMRATVYPEIQAIDAGAKAPLIRPVTVAGLQGVELYGNYQHPRHGPLRWRLVGLPHPKRSAVVIALAQISVERVALESVDDMALTPSGRVIESLRFSEVP